MKRFVQFLPSIFSLAVIASGIFAAPVQGYVTAHPLASLMIGGFYQIISHLLPSPLQQ